MLIDGDGEWDALVVERDMPVMDGFQITSALRDFEKARRNRASTVRAAAVEGHAETGGGTGGKPPPGRVVRYVVVYFCCTCLVTYTTSFMQSRGSLRCVCVVEELSIFSRQFGDPLTQISAPSNA